jgi:hypothetical protein
MNLGKLLGAGKSFISGGKPAAYRTDKRVYLPQFISPKNPFAHAAPAEVQSDLPKPATSSPAGPARKAKPSWAKTQQMFTAPPQAGPTRVTTWASKFNPVAIFREAAAPPNRAATPVQGELSLEKVKVVHNDLTDADVEVVPIKSRPARDSAMEAVPARKKWADLGERIMKATAL